MANTLEFIAGSYYMHPAHIVRKLLCNIPDNCSELLIIHMSIKQIERHTKDINRPRCSITDSDTDNINRITIERNDWNRERLGSHPKSVHSSIIC